MVARVRERAFALSRALQAVCEGVVSDGVGEALEWGWQELEAAGVDAISLANNHSMDFGGSALAANGNAAMALLVTHLSASAGAMASTSSARSRRSSRGRSARRSSSPRPTGTAPGRRTPPAPR